MCGTSESRAFTLVDRCGLEGKLVEERHAGVERGVVRQGAAEAEQVRRAGLVSSSLPTLGDTPLLIQY